LLFDRDEGLNVDDDTGGALGFANAAIGASVIRTVRSYDALVHDATGDGGPEEALKTLRGDVPANHHPGVLHALEQVVRESEVIQQAPQPEAEPAMAEA
jgi:hypothetical protein